jgi:hypothetical protein
MTLRIKKDYFHKQPQEMVFVMQTHLEVSSYQSGVAGNSGFFVM